MSEQPTVLPEEPTAWATTSQECTVTDPAGDAARKERQKAERQKIQRQLDEALADSFPASDPVSIVTSHEEEDWGTGDEPPPPPEKPAKPAPAGRK